MLLVRFGLVWFGLLLFTYRKSEESYWSYSSFEMTQ